MIRAILFDMGGTLDGKGHWLDRFHRLYESEGLNYSRQKIREAFDHAEQRAAKDLAIAGAQLNVMVDRHVGWQLEYLGLGDVNRRLQLVSDFVAPVRTAASENAPILARLQNAGFRLGVVSNGCGNLDVLCRELGYSPYLALTIDSRNVNVSKPDPAIYHLAAQKLQLPASAIMMIGDSLERDIRPAKSIGMLTGWLDNSAHYDCGQSSMIDLRLTRLADLPSMLAAAPLTT